MSSENTVSKDVLSAVTKLVAILSPLAPGDRHRAISAAMILFPQSPAYQNDPLKDIQSGENPEAYAGLSSKAVLWMKKNAITRTQLEHVFSIEAGVIEVIARMPDAGKRAQTIQAYILCGVCSFLKSGDMAFADVDARELCNKVGCYDLANHANYCKGFGNFISGTKGSGWKLTVPGLSEAAQIIKRITPEIA